MCLCKLEIRVRAPPIGPSVVYLIYVIEIINNKARHDLIDANCRWRSDWIDGAGSFREPLGQMKVMQIRQRETMKFVV